MARSLSGSPLARASHALRSFLRLPPMSQRTRGSTAAKTSKAVGDPRVLSCCFSASPPGRKCSTCALNVSSSSAMATASLLVVASATASTD
eukprot:2542927-Pyramimonas_sp.AAC.1